MSLTKITITAALVGAVLLSSPAPSHAVDPKADHRPCVSNRESHSGNLQGLTQTELEKRWEVTGRGILSVNPLGWLVMAYPWCDHQFHNHSLDAYEYVGVIYIRGKFYAVTWTKAPVYAEPEPAPTATVPPLPEPTPVPCPPTKCPNPPPYGDHPAS